MECYKCKKGSLEDEMEKIFCERCYAQSKKEINNTFRREVRRELPLRCEFCGEENKEILTLDHIDSKGERYNVDNVQWLCYNCHHLKTIGKISPNRHKVK